MPITFSLQVAGSAFGDDLAAMTETVQKAEEQGFAEIRVADHPGTTFDPFVLLAHFAAHTNTIRIGTYVLNLGVRHPLDVAISSITLDVISGGRFTLGVGAGHTPNEWTQRGQNRPNVDGRIRNFFEAVDTLPALMAGQEVTFHGEHIQLDAAQIEKPQAIQTPIPVLVGGTNRRLLRWGARHCDIVGFTGLGPTKPDGHSHEVRWAPEAMTERINVIRDEAEANERSVPQLDVLVQGVTLTDDRIKLAGRVAENSEELEPAHALDTPFLLMGSPGFLATQLQEFQDRWGITSYCVRPDAVDAAVQIMEALNG